MLSFYLKESLDITKIKDPEHSKESEVDFSGNLGRGVLLLSILFVIVYAILLVKFRRYIGAFEASLTPMIIGLISSILTLPLHELLHAICISSKNNVQIYRVKSGLMTWFTAPITKRRYLGMLLVPVLLLGFIPSICTFVIPETMPGFITFVLIFSLGNIGMSCGDLTNFIITAILNTYLLQVCQLLIENQTLPRADEAVNSFREQLPQIEAALQEAQLHVIPNNLAVIGAISFYKLTNATKYQHFLSWVKENSITRVPGLHMNDLIQIFDQIYENRPKSIFVSMQFSVETEDTYQTIKDVRDILKRENGLEIKLIKIDEHHDGYSDEIYHRIIDGIKESSLVIADLSFGNKNVHHEIGYAQGLAKKVLLLYKTRDGVPANSEIGSNISMHDQVRFRNQAELRPILLRKIREFFGIEVDD